jgi:hypothetical protein
LNHVFIEGLPNTLPQHIQDHVADIRDTPRLSPEPDAEAMAASSTKIKHLHAGCGEADVTGLLRDWVVPPEPHPSHAGLEFKDRLPMSQHLIPSHPDAGPGTRVTQPKPDRLYGYPPAAALSPFSQSQRTAQRYLDKMPGQRFVESNGLGLQFPFLALELKADAGTGGSLWVAANQAAGDAAACLNAAERLNDLLAGTDHEMVDNMTYCVAMDNRAAELYVSWKPERLEYYMYQVGAYMLCKEADFKEFRRHVRNIMDWGRTKRLDQIRRALDAILEEHRKKAAEAAKARPSPSAGSSSAAGGPSKRRRSSSSGGRGRGY